MRKRHEETTKSRVLARIIRTLLHDEEFETLADLVEALKFRCARLHLHWTNEDITNALRIIASNRALLVDRPRPNVPHGTLGVEVGDPISRDLAPRILARLGVEL